MSIEAEVVMEPVVPHLTRSTPVFVYTDMNDAVSHAHIQALVDAIPYFVMLIDEHHRIVMTNAHTAEMLGLSRETAIGHYCPKVVHGMSSPYPGCPLEDAVASGEDQLEKELYDRSTDRWMNSAIYLTPFTLQQGSRIYLHIVRDITAKKREQEAVLRRSYDTQRVIAEILRLSLQDLPLDDMLAQVLDRIVSIPWLSFDSRGAVFVVDESANTLVMKASTGLRPDQLAVCANVPFGTCLCGRAAEQGRIVFADHVDDDHDIAFPDMADHGHYCVPIRYAGRTLGVITTYLVKGHRPEPAEWESLSAIAATVAGILVRRKTEREHALLEEQIRQARRMEALGRLAGGVAHDFNNLLSVILGSLTLLKEEVGLPDAALEDLGDIETAATRAAGLTKQLLAFSRQQMHHPESVSLNEVVRETQRMLQRTIREDVELEVVLDPDCGSLLIDRSLLEQAIVNLAINARDAMRNGGQLKLTTSTREYRPGDGASGTKLQPGTYVALEVSDTGTGIADDVLPHIFEPFYTTKEVGKGTGLGLATVYGMVQQASGNIDVHTVLGEGTRITLAFPRTDVVVAPTTHTDAGPPKAQKTATILLVEDDRAVRSVARRLLARRGYHVIEATDPEAALATSKGYDGTIDLLLTDIVMPGMNGVELAQILVRTRPEITTLFMTGYAENALDDRGADTRDLEVIHKPFTGQYLLQMVSRALS